MVWPDFWSLLVLELTLNHQFSLHFLITPDTAHSTAHKHILCSNTSEKKEVKWNRQFIENNEFHY